MDLNAYLLDGVVDSTTPPGETAANAQSRREAIGEMFRAFDPRDAMEAMIACHCVALQFLLNGAMRDAGNVNQEPAMLTRARAGAMAISKTLHQWVSKLEKIKQRKEVRAAEALKAARANIAAVAAPEPEPLAARPQPPGPPLDKPRPVSRPGEQPAWPDLTRFEGLLPKAAAVPPPGGRPQVRADGPSARVPG